MSSPDLPTRERILAATRGLLVEGKGRAVRMADVASEAGLSRQAVYLHFANRTELLIATTDYVDEQEGLRERTRPYREAANGMDSLREFVAFWGRYIEAIYPLGSALLAAGGQDQAARAAWGSRMSLLRRGCNIVVTRLAEDGLLDEQWDLAVAGDLLFAIVSLRTWEILTQDYGWSTDQFVERMRVAVERVLLSRQGDAKPRGQAT